MASGTTVQVSHLADATETSLAHQHVILVIYVARTGYGYPTSSAIRACRSEDIPDITPASPSCPLRSGALAIKLAFNFKRALGGMSAAASTTKSTMSTIVSTPQASAPMTAPAGTPSLSRSATKRVYADEVEEGVGARVRRSIGSQSLRNLSPFLMLDVRFSPYPLTLCRLTPCHSISMFRKTPASTIIRIGARPRLHICLRGM
jgi:hypothetical protein